MSEVQLPDSLSLPPELSGPVHQVTELTHNTGNAATGGIWRLQLADRAVVAKVARPPQQQPAGSPGWQTSDVPSHWNYWRRELNAYSASFATEVYAEAGIGAPDLLALSTRADGSAVLWLDHVQGSAGTDWSIERFGAFARQLGQAQGSWLNDLPDQPWLSRNWLAGYLADRQIPAVVPWDEPAGNYWPAELRDGLRNLWESRAHLVEQIAATPRTLCHLDVWPMNLIATADQTVLLDWAFVGIGALGEDPANLIVDSVADGLIEVALLPEIEEAVIAGYLAGLRQSGSEIDEATVRRTIAASGAAKYSWLGPALPGSRVPLDRRHQLPVSHHCGGAIRIPNRIGKVAGQLGSARPERLTGWLVSGTCRHPPSPPDRTCAATSGWWPAPTGWPARSA